MKRHKKIRWICLSVVDSTNEYAMREVDGHNVVVRAIKQLAGKGRDGRTFLSDEGGVYMSLVRRDCIPVEESAKYYMAAPLAVCDALLQLGVDACIKWPNDVRVGKDKIAGILVENVLRDGMVDKAVIGIGVNVANDVSTVPCAATNLVRLASRATPKRVAKRIAVRLDALLEHSLEDLRLAIKDRLLTLGKTVIFADGREGVAVDLAADGRLVVQCEGRESLVAAGDVTLKEEVC